jgi:hypothetical protein
MGHGAWRSLGDNIKGVDVVVAAAGTTSESIGLSGWSLVGIITPAAMDSVAISFTAAQSSTFVPVYSDTGSAYSVTCAASRYIIVDPTKLLGVNLLKLVMGSTETNAITLTLVLRRVA